MNEDSEIYLNIFAYITRVSNLLNIADIHHAHIIKVLPKKVLHKI